MNMRRVHQTHSIATRFTRIEFPYFHPVSFTKSCIHRSFEVYNPHFYKIRFNQPSSKSPNPHFCSTQTMSRLRRIEIFEPDIPPSLFLAPQTLAFPSVFEEVEFDRCFALDLLSPNPSPFQLFDNVTDFIQINQTPSFCSYKRIQQRVGPEVYLQSLCDGLSVLESKFDRLVNARSEGRDRKYTWTSEIKGAGVDRKYKWTAEIKGERKKKGEKGRGVGKSYKWTAEIKGKGEERPIIRSYTFKASTGDAGDHSGSEKKEKKGKKEEESDLHVVEIEEHADHGAVVLRQAFAKRAGAVQNSKGKKKELSPQDAALMIQMTFRAYLIRRSQTLRALRELAVAKSKLKEIRALFNNFSYRRRVASDAEERQRFSEKIIVLLLTVDAIEGADLMVRAARRSMVNELEAMLNAVDPQPAEKSLSMRRRTFDMPDGVIQKEITAGVAQVVQMLDQEENGANAFEVCL